MSDKNMSIQQRYEHEFNNSTDVGQSLWRLVKEPPEAVVRRLVAKFIGLIVSIMDSILETLGISLTEPDKLWENVDKATEKTKLLSLVMVRVSRYTHTHTHAYSITTTHSNPYNRYPG